MYGMSFMQKGVAVRDPLKEKRRTTRTRVRGKKMWTIRLALACMCQHIDAQTKMLSPSIQEEELVAPG
jgi:hypothetical protein